MVQLGRFFDRPSVGPLGGAGWGLGRWAGARLSRGSPEAPRKVGRYVGRPSLLVGTLRKAAKGPKSYQTYVLNSVVPEMGSEPHFLEVLDLPDDGDHTEGRKKVQSHTKLTD